MRRKSFFLSFFLILSVLGASPFLLAQETLDRILVVVNDEIITEADLRIAIEPLAAQYRATLSGHELQVKIEEAREVYLEQLVNERLIRSAARREKITVDEEEVEEMMEEVRSKFPTQEAFERVLREQGLSLKKLKERFRDRILNRRMVDLKVRSQITISPGDVLDYYDEHQAEFKGPEKAKVQQILIRVGDQRSDEEAAELAWSIVRELDRGGDMKTLAKLYSEAAEAEEGGDMGWVERGQLIDKIDRQIFSQPVGEHTQPIRSQLGYHIFRVEDRRESEARSFDQVRNRVQNILFRQKTKEKLEAWLGELRRNAYVAYKT